MTKLTLPDTIEEMVDLEKIIQAALPAALKAANCAESLPGPLHTMVIDAECILLGLNTTLKGARLARLRILAKEMEVFLT